MLEIIFIYFLVGHMGEILEEKVARRHCIKSLS